jgi:hypothetical protein
MSTIVGRAAKGQQPNHMCHQEPPRIDGAVLWSCRVTQGFVVGAVPGLPGWHARGQGFKSPQLHQAQRIGRTPAQSRLSADCQQITVRGR